MIKARAWPMRAMYILLAVAFAIGLFITGAPAHQVSAATDTVKAQWDTVDTPTLAGWVLAPESSIIDFAYASDGDVAYVVAYAYDENWANQGDYLLKSDNAAATWTDLTATLESQVETDGWGGIYYLLRVETDGSDPNFIAVALVVTGTGASLVVMTPIHVYFSTDGGDTFVDAGEVADGNAYFTAGPSTFGVTDLAVSPEVNGKRDIAVGGGPAVHNPPSTVGPVGIFRATVTGETASAWADATDFDGWDNGTSNGSLWVTFMEFSPNFATDKTLLVTTVGTDVPGPSTVYLQCGTWGTTTPGWNDASALGILAVPTVENVNMPTFLVNIDTRGLAGLTLPSDYNSKNSDTRILWVWANYWDNATGDPQSKIMRVDNDSADPVVQQVKTGTLWLTNISYYGTIAEGKAIAGILGTGGYNINTGGPTDILSSCEPIQVYRNGSIANMDICCVHWEKACKPPTGETAMAVEYVSQDKAYAVALDEFDSYHEGAWSVSFDDGNTWNQLSLVDTYINYFSDVAVSPDCNKMWVTSVYQDDWEYDVPLPPPSVCYTIEYDYGNGYYDIRILHRDSVWLKATDLPEASEYSGYWLRVWNGALMGEGFEKSEQGFIRLPADETAGDTVFLVDYGTNYVYMNDLEGLGCWTPISSTTLDDIVDLAAPTADTLYALDYNGDVSMYDSEGWHDAVASKVDNGWTIAVHGDYVLVGSAWDGQVSYSDDAGATFTLLDKTVPMEGADNGHTTVAFDTYFDTNSVIYAAIEGWSGSYSSGGIYYWTLGTDTDWNDTGADHDYAYTGIILSYLGGNPFTSADTGGVLYASYKYMDGSYARTGVARCLTPLAGVITCSSCTVGWDYLTYGLPDRNTQFEATPFALKACGCTTPDTTTHLYAVETRHDYNMIDGTYAGDYYYDDARNFVDDVGGAVWTFEDCYAKANIQTTSPADGAIIGTSSCGCCNVPFTVKWDQLCDACYYDIQFALDSAFTEPVELTPSDSSSLPPTIEGPYSGLEGIYYTVHPDNGANPTEFLGCYFQPETTYYWRIRAAGSGDQEIHSWWSDAQSFIVAPTAAVGAIDLVAPTAGANDVGIKNVGFSWHTLANVDNYQFVLSPNADLSAALATKTVTGTATTYAGPLTYATTYYWQVTAYKDGSAISVSPIGTFTTTPHGAYCSAIDGACFDSEAALEAHNTAVAGQAAPTPFWVWVVIGIGAVLVIVVIVLIFRTRRV
jgi:hypothetical protein